MTSGISYRLLLLAGFLSVSIFSLNTFVMLPAAVVSNQPQQFLQSAFATFPGENGKIAFSSVRTLSIQIYTINPDGSNLTQLTNVQDANYFPDWSPDGKKIVFTSIRDPRGNVDIYVMNADGSGQTRLTTNPDLDEYPTWSPDGTKIAFTIFTWGEDNYEIYVMNADGSNPTRLTNDPSWDHTPSWSPDGTKIAFSSHRDGNWEIYVMNADGSGQTRLTTNPDIDEVEPDWSSDGTKIAYRHIDYETANDEIYVMNADGSGQTNISNHPAADGTPDGGSTGAPLPPPPEEDTIPPSLTVPEDIVANATTANGGTVVTYNVTAEDNVDGTATLEEDGTTITQDDVGGNIAISCDPPSGTEFPVGETVVECTATDADGNSDTESFMVTVNPPTQPPPPPLTTPREAIERLISYIENLEDVPDSAKKRLTSVLERALALLTDNNTRNDASACNMLGSAFINQVNANERRGSVTEDQAADVRTQVVDIRDIMGC